MATLLRRSRAMPVFWPEQLRASLGEERYARAVADPDSADVLTWDVFASLDRHSDRDWLAYRLQALGGTGVRAPVRIALWTGRDAEPHLVPSRGYVAAIRSRVAAAGLSEPSLAAFEAPVEVPVRIESPDVLVLVETVLRTFPRGAQGRDRIVELVDAGLVHAQRLDKSLSLAVVYDASAPAAGRVQTRVAELGQPGALAAELPYADAGALAGVQLRAVTWQQLLKVWEAEADYLGLPTSERALLDHLRRRGFFV